MSSNAVYARMTQGIVCKSVLRHLLAAKDVAVASQVLRHAHTLTSPRRLGRYRRPQDSAILAFISSRTSYRPFSTRFPLNASSPRSSDSPNPPPKEQFSSSEATGKSDQESDSAHKSSKQQQAEDGSGESESSQSKEEQTQNKDAPHPPPPHGNKSPWQVFRDTMRSEFEASKEWQDSTKSIASSAHEFSERESVRKVRAAYSAASDAASSGTSSALKSTGRAIGQSAAWTWDSTAMKWVRAGANSVGEGLEKATRPVRETSAYKSVKNVIDDGSSSRYGGWVDKEARKKARELREVEAAKTGGRTAPAVEDPNAGTNVTLHKDAAWKESWRDFRDSNRLMQSLFSLKSSYNESENPFISTARSISDRVAGFFAENETARVIKAFREMDPTFQIEPFLRELREYILPEVLDAYVKGDTDTLSLWLSAAQFQVYAALQQQWKQHGLKPDGRILDIRHVDIAQARMLEPGDVPIFIISARTQEVHVYRQVKTGELAAGMEDKVQLVTYALGLTRTSEEVNNPETRGWRIIELHKSNRDYI